MSEKTQLTRITVPAITDARYIEGLSDAFNKINDNFKKIASLPFLQGVQGDSYQLEEYKIWNDNLSITEDGKVLLDSIFGKDVTVEGNYFTDIRDYIGEKLDGVSPLDFFVTEDDNTIINNALYFYVIKDDTGNVIEKQLGQYYYFVDGRLKNIGNVYNGEISGVSLDGFNDYTGFYQYKYNPKSYNQKYLKVEILPAIYYDQDKNDICWKFNGNETGISAIGVKGADGKDADLLIVKATANESDCVGTVEAIINPIGANNSTEQWIDDPEDFKEGKALICIQRSGVAQDFAYGQVIKVNGVFNAYWEPNYVFSKLIGDNRITNYFYNMGGEDETATAPFYLAIPSYSNRSPSGDIELKKCAHVIDGKNISDGSNLRIFYSEKVFDENGNQQWNPMPTEDSVGTAGTLDIENYNVNIGKQLRVLSGAHISGSLGVKDGLQLHTGQLTVSENVQISGSLGVDNRITVGYGGDDSINISTGALVVSGGIGVSKSVNIGKNLTIEESLKVKGTSGATDERNADVVIYGGVGIGKDVIVGSSGKMKIKNRGVVQYDSDGTVDPSNTALNVFGDIYSKTDIIAKNKSESYFSVLTGANDSNIARGVSGLQALVEANNEGTIFSGGGTQAAIGSTNGLNRTVYNRTALQSYHTKLKDSSKSYEPLEYFINPCGGQVSVNKYAGHGGAGKTLSVSNAFVVDGGLYARTKKPTSVVDKGDANGLSNVLIGHNDPGNSQFEDFPKDLDKGGYPLVIKSIQKSTGNVSDGAMVFGIGDIYALSGNNTTGYSAGTLCLNHRTRYRGDVQIGRNLNVGDNDLGGNVTIYSTDDSNGRLIAEGKIIGQSGIKINRGGEIFGVNNGDPSGGIGLTVEGGSGVTGHIGGVGLVVKGGTSSNGSTGLGLKVERGGAEIYSGNGTDVDDNILKVNGSAVYVSGIKGLLSAHNIVSDTAGIYERSNGGTKDGITYTLNDLITNNEGNVYCGGINDPESGKNVFRTIHNRSSVQSYEHKNNSGTQQYTGVTFYINPCGGTVSINQRVPRGELFKSSTSTTTGALVVNGGVGISENLHVGERLVVNKNGTNNISDPSEIYGRYANSGGTSNGGTGLIVRGGAGREINDPNNGNGGVGLVVYGGSAGKYTGSTSSEAGWGGTGLVVYGGAAGAGPQTSNTGHTGVAIKTYGNVVIGDRTGSYLTTLSANSTGLKMDKYTTLSKGATINSTAVVKGTLDVTGFTDLGTISSATEILVSDMTLFNYLDWDSAAGAGANLTIDIDDDKPHFIFCKKSTGDPNLIFKGGYWGTGSKSHNITTDGCLIIISILNGYAGYSITGL